MIYNLVFGIKALGGGCFNFESYTEGLRHVPFMVHCPDGCKSLFWARPKPRDPLGDMEQQSVWDATVTGNNLPCVFMSLVPLLGLYSNLRFCGMLNSVSVF